MGDGKTKDSELNDSKAFAEFHLLFTADCNLL
jgi:hypothetical protein